MKVDKFKLAIAYWIGWLVVMCFIFYFDTIDGYRNAEKAKAVVVDRLIGYGRKGSYYYPQFRFEYQDSSYFFAEPLGFAPSRYRVGDKATVIFPKGDPDKAEVYAFLPY